MKGLLQFLQYNNAVPVVFTIIFLGAGSAFAATNPEVFVATQQTTVSPDTTYIATVDVANLNFQLRIIDVTQDVDRYYVTYTYRSIGPIEYVWKEYDVEKVLTVSHKELEGKDLGLFVARQLGELMVNERGYLQEVQTAERTRGASSKVVMTEYSGLIGKFLDAKEEVFPGYAPLIIPEVVVPPQSIEVAAVVISAPEGEGTVSIASPSEHIPTPAELDARIELKVNEILAQKSLQTSVTEPIIESAPVPAPVEPVEESPVVPLVEEPVSAKAKEEPIAPTVEESVSAAVEEPTVSPEPAPAE